MTTTSWRPILAGAERQAALDTVLAIADALIALPEETLPAQLGRGAAGFSLFFCHLGRHSGVAEHRELAEHYAALAMERMTGTGIAWLLEHLRTQGYEVEADVTEDVDALLLERLSGPYDGEFDLIGGLVGLGIYALEGQMNERRRQILERVIARLAEVAQPRPAGCSWLAPPMYLGDDPRFPDGGDNFGMAHGTPGVIALLGATAARGLFVDQARPLLERAVSWQRTYDQVQHPYRRYAYSIVDPSQRSRLAWCYGDPGIAVALLIAARGLGDEALGAQAEALITSSTRCPPEQAGIEDAALCHGAIGLGHLFNRLGQATRSEVLIESARDWIRRGLAMRKLDVGIAGYQANYRGEWIDDPGYLTGAAGIGLGLLAAVSESPPTWDQPLLLLC